MDNREFAAISKEFIKACEKAGVNPTKRQASKFRMRKGKAYQWHINNPSRGE